jgi:hypothetical protein
MYGLFVVEFLLIVAVLTLFGIADPNTYRTKLWQNGADKGFNSDPSIVLYSYANYKPIDTPVVWSQLYVLSSRMRKRDQVVQDTNTSQYDNLQRSCLRPRHVHPAGESGGVRHAPLPPTAERIRPRPHARPLRRVPPQPVNTRHERSRQP